MLDRFAYVLNVCIYASHADSLCLHHHLDLCSPALTKVHELLGVALDVCHHH
jgi:hypothetical protein